MQVIFIFGPAASGKHTIGSLLAKKLDLPLFHNHLTVDLVCKLFKFGSDEFKQLRAAIWKESFRAAAEGGQSFIFTFHPEKTVQANLIKELQSAVEDCGGRVQYIELLCPEAEIERRLDNPSRSQYGKLQDLDFYRELREAGQFEFSHLPTAHFSIDTQSVDAESAAERIHEYLMRHSG